MEQNSERVNCHPYDEKTLTRFWRKVRKTDKCWTWTAGDNGEGYGLFRISVPYRAQVLAHRFAWEITNGSIPPGVLVCHHCDNPSCVNPSHLFLGSHADNLKDMDRKGRRVSNTTPRYGEDNPASKLSQEEVEEIRGLYIKGDVSLQELGLRYGVSVGNVHMVVRGDIWGPVSSDYLTQVDAVTRVRNSHKGPKLWKQKINDQAVQQIRDRYSQGGVTQTSLAQDYDISLSQVNRIIHQTRRA